MSDITKGIIVAMFCATILIALAVTIDSRNKQQFVQHGYHQVMVVGNDFPVWQKAPADSAR